MAQPAIVIPEKIYFKIGEVCELVGVQAHVLRYWETEFPMLSPQKNRSGQRSYRRRDVEMAFRIKQLLYDEMFTIAGAKKKLQAEMRGEVPRLKVVHSDSRVEEDLTISNGGHGLLDEDLVLDEAESELPANEVMNPERKEALRSLASQLLELREMLKTPHKRESEERLRK
ncbi:MAG TPA: MerR family transcriptional regulator [Pyrinomonadaceae bacterium]